MNYYEKRKIYNQRIITAYNARLVGESGYRVETFTGLDKKYWARRKWIFDTLKDAQNYCKNEVKEQSRIVLYTMVGNTEYTEIVEESSNNDL